MPNGTCWRATTGRVASTCTSLPAAADSTCDVLRTHDQIPGEELGRNGDLGGNEGRGPSLSQFGPLKEPTGKLVQVFISHSGRQKRGFVDFLAAEFRKSYPAVSVFLDEYSLVPGGDALQSLHAKLEDADVVVVVLSREFITTFYPMEELHLLLERRMDPNSRAVILPVFYDVTWEEVHAQVLEYKKAAAKEAAAAPTNAAAGAADAPPDWALLDVVDEQIVFKQQASDAALRAQQANDLQGMARITGIRTDQAANARGTELVRIVARQAARALAALNKLPTTKSQALPPVLVGLGVKQARAIQLLTTSGRLRVVLLHGMGGIGKTTLAKAVFNELHERNRTVPCCFLEVGPGIKDASALLPKQRELLQELAGDGEREPSDASEALRLMEEKLRGKRVLVVVDSVWRDQLVQLLPVCVLKVLGKGSVVLVTSRDRDAAEHLKSLRFAAEDAAGIQLVEEEVECLTPAQSLELFSWHAIGLTRLLEVEEDLQTCSAAVQNWRRASGAGCSAATLRWLVEDVCRGKKVFPNSSASDAAQELQAFVGRCGGLPMALELVGKHLAKVEPGAEARQAFACPEETFQLVYSEASGMFEALRHSWDGLGVGDQKDHLLDIAWFLQKRSWGLVECYGKAGVLAKLRRLGLVQKCAAGGGGGEQPAVTVHPVVADFCKLGIEAAEAVAKLRRECHQDAESCTDVLELMDPETLKDIMDERPVGLSLRGWLLDANACAQLKRGSKLRVLQMHCQVEPTPLALKAASMHWLGVGGTGNAAKLCLDLQVLRTAGAKPGGVIVLEHSAKLRRIEFPCTKPKFKPLLKGLWITECKGLEHVDLSGLAALQQLRIEGCEQLQEVQGLDCLSQLEVLQLAGCSARVVASCLATAPSLTRLALTSCSVVGLPGLPQQQPLLQELQIEGCPNLLSLSGLQRLHHLSSLELLGCQRLQQVHLPTSLEKLLMDSCPSLERLTGLAHPTMPPTPPPAAPTPPHLSPALRPSPPAALPPTPPSSPGLHTSAWFYSPSGAPSTPPQSPPATHHTSPPSQESSPPLALALTDVSISGCSNLLPLPCLGHLQHLERCTYHLAGGGGHNHPHRQGGPGSPTPFTWERSRACRGAPAACPCPPDQKVLFSTPPDPAKVLAQTSTFNETWTAVLKGPR